MVLQESPTPTGLRRCTWCGNDPLYVAYHDSEWGVPERDPRALWEKLVLDGFQAGLSWITILRKRPTFREAFEGFDPERIARWGPAEVERLLTNPGIVRSRAKIAATIGNARAFVQAEGTGSGFAPWIWSFVDGRPQQHHYATAAEVPAETAESRALSRALHRAGFRFCGPVITYAFMQACGLVNDHLVTCPQYRRVAALAQ